MTNPILVFWLLVAATAVSMTWADYLSRLALERTVRHAIDKGLIVDAEGVLRLKPPVTRSWGVRLAALGGVLMGVGVGVIGLALCLGVDKPKSLTLFGGIAALILCGAGGLILSGLWLRRVEKA